MRENNNELLKHEALRIIEVTDENKIPIRLLGGMAIYICSPCAKAEPYLRVINDLDFVVPKKKAYALEKLLEKNGYQGDHEFNSIHGEYRLLFHSDLVELDIFVGEFAQCHRMKLEKYIPTTKTTIPLANLLLTKLQIIEINQKDIVDILALLHDHEVIDEGDSNEIISMNEMNAILSDDWGWYTTCMDNLAKIQQFVQEFIISPDQNLLLQKIVFIQSQAQCAKKSLKWTLRSKVGRRVQWYELPEEK